ncbi:DUF5682 family protein [Pseudonocardia sp. TRM90224]|uniref:DUF5682 family protein n=1 Tax=Pseudonocardia sp. TRM90224 TaxID=2812678 RepID=UPI001E5532B2|nr:DUF5682 family protein [Pseudonocardia sp. TRM90224]
MTATGGGRLEIIGVRHHSPACAQLVRERITALRPAFVLVEGPSDINGRLAELRLGHTLPVAVFSYLRVENGTRASWTPFCDHSPEWIALTEGHAAGADVRFIDLPAWHPAFADRTNRYADAEQRYADAVDRLCQEFAIDNSDALWDHLVETGPDGDLGERLAIYFDGVRGDATAGASDQAREAYMARWIRAALAEAPPGAGPVLVVCGGFHRPALLAAAERPEPGWPEVPAPPEGAVGGSYLVPYSHRRLDAFEGYQSGLPSPGFYQRLWDEGAESAAAWLMDSVVARLRRRKQHVSTAHVIAATTQARALAAVRGHRHPARTDVLDALVSTLVAEGLEERLPWTVRNPQLAGAHPVVAEMVAALTGDRTGRLAPGTPHPPLPAAVDAELAALGLDGRGPLALDLTAEDGLLRSRVLHRLRVLRVPGFERTSGPRSGRDPVAREEWRLTPSDLRLSALIEAAAFGATLADAAEHALAERVVEARGDVAVLASVLFDAVLCGTGALAGRVGPLIAAAVADTSDVPALGAALASVLGLWRHDRLLGAAGDPGLAGIVDAAARRLVWLLEGIRGGPQPADPGRLAAVVALRDAVRHAAGVLTVDRADVVAMAGRIGPEVPPDLRGAAAGLRWSLGEPAEPAELDVPWAPKIVGDWLAGLFALAREEVLTTPSLVATLDDLVGELTDADFLVALPALRQAFEFFPPRERAQFAELLLNRRGHQGDGRALLRTTVDPLLLAEAAALEHAVDEILTREGLLP